MKASYLILLILLGNAFTSYSQPNERISTLDFVQILKGNRAEAFHYCQKNGQKLRKKALDKKYIASYEFLDMPSTSDNTFNIILITTCANREMYNRSEAHFEVLIKEQGSIY